MLRTVTFNRDGRSWPSPRRASARSSVAVLGAIVLTGLTAVACASASGHPATRVASDQPTSSSSSAGTPAPKAAAVLVDLHQLSLNDITYPAGVCRSTAPVQVRGSSTAVETQDGPFEVSRATEVPPAFGDLDGDGHDELGVTLVCAPSGGNGYYLQAVVLRAASSATPGLVGFIEGKYRGNGLYSSQISGLSLAPGKVVVAERYFTADDSHASPSGRARTVWTYEQGRLTAGTPVALDAATSSSSSCPSRSRVQEAVAMQQGEAGYTEPETLKSVRCAGDLVHATVAVDVGGGATQDIQAFLRQEGGSLTVVTAGSASHCGDSDGDETIAVPASQRAALGC